MRYKFFGIILSTILTIACNGGVLTCEGAGGYTDLRINEFYITHYQDLEEPIENPEEYIIQINIEPERIEYVQIYTPVFPKLKFSLFSSAYATTCAPRIYGETISYIEITSDSDFDAGYLAGQSLNDLFSVDFLFGTIEENIYGEPLYTTGFDLVLSRMPTLDRTHQFTIIIELDSGRQFTLELQEISFAE